MSRILGFKAFPGNMTADEDPADDYNHPVYYSSPTDPIYTIHCTENWGTCPVEGKQVRIPPNAVPTASSDAHMTIVDQSTNTEWGFWGTSQTRPAGGGTLNIRWSHGSVKIDGSGLNGGGVAGHYGNLAGIIRGAELQAGRIPHALFLVVRCTNNTYVYPASGLARACSAIGESNTNAPADGARIWLNMSESQINALSISSWQKTILHALREYGAIVGDTGGAGWNFELESPLTYKAMGVAHSPTYDFGAAAGWAPYNGGYVAKFDAIPSSVWGNLKVLDPCVSNNTCPSIGTTPPTVSLTASSNTIISGTSTTLNWSSTDATSCTGYGGWTGSKATSGTFQTGNLTANTSYGLTCTNAGGSTNAGTSVYVTGGSGAWAWNARTATVDSNSSTYMSTFTGYALNNPNLVMSNWAVATVDAGPNDPTYTIPRTDQGGSISVRIPLGTKPDPSGDGHLTVRDIERNIETDFWQAVYDSSTGKISSASAAVSFSLDAVNEQTTGWGGNAANTPLRRGLVTPEQIQAGQIKQTLQFSTPQIGPNPPRYPALHNAPTCGSTCTNHLPEGTWMRLDPTVNVDALSIPAWQKTIAKALQDYGMILRDNAGTFGIYAENTINRGGAAAWTGTGLSGNSAAFSANFPWASLQVLNPPNTSPTPKTGDVNNDGLVNIFDLSILLTDYGKDKTAAANQACDINNDNAINIFDLSILLSKYGT